jgi:hypothetical protein
MTNRIDLVDIRIAAEKMSAAASAAYWATDEDRREYLVIEARTALIAAADAMGVVIIERARHDALLGFIEEVRDFKPTIIIGRAHDPQNDVDDLMTLEEFASMRADAATLFPATKKEKK